MTYGAPLGSTEPTYMMALELCDGGDLELVVLKNRKQEFTRQTALKLATGVARGMAYVHREEVLHLDLKLVRGQSSVLRSTDSEQTLTLHLPHHCSCRRM
jgi:serine/threonine protein kinase